MEFAYSDDAFHDTALTDDQLSFRLHGALEPAMHPEGVFESQFPVDLAAGVKKAIQFSGGAGSQVFGHSSAHSDVGHSADSRS